MSRKEVWFEENVLIRKIRRLPVKGEVIVAKGERVQPDALIAYGKVRNPEIVEVRIDQKLGVDPLNLRGHVLKVEGDPVKKDEAIAIKRSFFGRSTKICRSPVDGTVEVFSETSGRMLIRALPISVEVRAHIPGTIHEVIPSEGATVECKSSLIKGVFGFGGEVQGELAIANDERSELLIEDSIKDSHAGKVLVGGSGATLGALGKAVQLGVKGIVVGGMDEQDVSEFVGYEIGLGITGLESKRITIILTEGFGACPMDAEIFDFLSREEGNLACIDGSTQIRTRMLRPELIIPL